MARPRAIWSGHWSFGSGPAGPGPGLISGARGALAPNRSRTDGRAVPKSAWCQGQRWVPAAQRVKKAAPYALGVEENHSENPPVAPPTPTPRRLEPMRIQLPRRGAEASPATIMGLAINGAESRPLGPLPAARPLCPGPRNSSNQTGPRRHEGGEPPAARGGGHPAFPRLPLSPPIGQDRTVPSPNMRTGFGRD